MSDELARALVKADRQLTTATEALRAIADAAYADRGGICKVCGFRQESRGACSNRDCPGFIARRALEDMRR